MLRAVLGPLEGVSDAEMIARRPCHENYGSTAPVASVCSSALLSENYGLTSGATAPPHIQQQLSIQIAPSSLLDLDHQQQQHLQRLSSSPAQVNQVSSTTTSLMLDIQNQPTLSSTDVQSQHAIQESDKKAICRHPLFPLLALLFEKCEAATAHPDAPPSDNFESDIQAFVATQDRVFDGNQELDNVMVKAIQVLRVHLLELQKVNELCRDFCARYINTVKNRYQNDAVILDVQPGSPDSECLSPPPPIAQAGALNGSWIAPTSLSQLASPISHSQLQQQHHISWNYPAMYTSPPVRFQQHQQLQREWASAAAGLLQIDPQHQQPPQPHPSPYHPSAQQQVSQSSSLMVNSSPISVVAANGHSLMSAGYNHHQPPQQQLQQNQQPPPSRTLTEDERHKLKRGVLPKRATQIMKQWLFQHLVHPYPTEDEKRHIAGQTNLTLLQVNNWFINARRRILQPMLDVSNPEQGSKKKKQTSSRPSNARFWPSTLVGSNKSSLLMDTPAVVVLSGGGGGAAENNNDSIINNNNTSTKNCSKNKSAKMALKSEPNEDDDDDDEEEDEEEEEEMDDEDEDDEEDEEEEDELDLDDVFVDCRSKVAGTLTSKLGIV